MNPEQDNSLESDDNNVVMRPTQLSSGTNSQGSGSHTGENVETTQSMISEAPTVTTKHRPKNPFRKINVYLMIFALLLIIAGIIVIFVYTSSSKTDSKTTIPTQTLTEDALKQLATSDVTVGQPKQLLNVQSNAVFAGKVLVRDSLEVAGSIQAGKAINIPGVSVTGNSTFADLQVNKTLNVTGNSSVQGLLNVQKDLTVAGSGSFGGPVSAPKIIINSIQLDGDLTLTKHIVAGGSVPSRSNGNALGSGGTTAISGSDTAGHININTGSGPAAGCFTSITFNKKFDQTPRVLVTPIGSAAAKVSYYVDRSTTGFSVCAADTPPANSTFGFDYFIVQ